MKTITSINICACGTLRNGPPKDIYVLFYRIYEYCLYSKRSISPDVNNLWILRRLSWMILRTMWIDTEPALHSGDKSHLVKVYSFNVAKLVLLIFCQRFFHLYFRSDIGCSFIFLFFFLFFSPTVLVRFWYETNTTSIKWIGKYSLLYFQ